MKLWLYLYDLHLHSASITKESLRNDLGRQNEILQSIFARNSHIFGVILFLNLYRFNNNETQQEAMHLLQTTGDPWMAKMKLMLVNKIKNYFQFLLLTWMCLVLNAGEHSKVSHATFTSCKLKCELLICLMTLFGLNSLTEKLSRLHRWIRCKWVEMSFVDAT